MRPKHRLVLTACALAACVAAPASTAAAAKKPSGKPIKIGLVAPGKGTPFFSLETLIATDKAAVRALNKRGGLAGRPVQLVYCNDKGDPNTTAACGRKLVSEKVIMEAGGNILNGPILTPILAKAGIAQVGINAFSGPELTSKNVFLMYSTFSGYSVLAGYASKHKLKIQIVGADNSSAAGIYSSIEAAAKSAGNPILGKTLVSATAADMQPFISAALSSNPGAIMELFGPPQTFQLLKGVAASGKPTKVLTAYYYHASDAKDVGGGKSLERVITDSNFLPFDQDNPLLKQYNNELKAEQRAGDADATPNKTIPANLSAWLSIWTLEQMVKSGKIKPSQLTAAGVMKAYSTVKKLDMKGVMPPWTPSAKGPPGLDRLSNPYYFLFTYTNGGAKTKLLTPKAVTAAQALAGKGV
jgi:ABC-type branched-subunit amino acid transport system substrate-binding protein